MTKTYELWEIMKDGKNGEIFEVVSCSLTSYKGHQLEVVTKKEHLGSFKCLVKPGATGDGESVLATLYGCLGTAKFKKVEHFEEIKYEEALKMLSEYRVIYSYQSGIYKELSRYTDLQDIYIEDFSDLMNKTFYKKG